LFLFLHVKLLGNNVNMLMPSSDAVDHDEYVKRYLRTGEARLIGKGRQVVAQRKDGTSFAITLCLRYSTRDGLRSHAPLDR
jgi:two-component system sensor kinase FixL